jgi:aerobic carbon-monoxide dehydrogenase large subunit
MPALSSVNSSITRSSYGGGSIVTDMIGQSVRRLEDPALLKGEGTFIANLRIPGMLHAAFVRSSMAHGRLVSVDTSGAAAAGAVAAYTGATLGVAPHHGFVAIDDDFKRPPLAVDRVRFVGEAVAIVIAETRSIAADAVASVIVDIDPLAASSTAEAALDDGSVPLFAQRADNVAKAFGDSSADPLAGAELVVSGRFDNQRVAVAPMETNSIATIPNADGSLTVYAATQMPHMLRDAICATFELSPDQVQVIAPHVGGGFGGKVALAAEFSAVIAAALHLRRPVTWTATRSEDLVALHGRGQIQYGELGLRRDGTFTGLRVRLLADAGSYPGIGVALTNGTKMMSSGVYAIPAIQFDIIAVATNTPPIGAYRGAGRPEATALIERLVDLAALETGIDPLELRRRNFIAADQFPYVTVSMGCYDSGDYDRALTAAAGIAGYEALRAEQAARRARGDTRQLGIGVATYVEVTGGRGDEFAAVTVHDNGRATVVAGTSAHGQGHATTFAQIVSARLGIPVDHIDFVQSDTKLVTRGHGTGGSRSIQLGGSAVNAAAVNVLEQAKQLAARTLEADPADVVVHPNGTLGIAGAPGARALSWTELAIAAGGELAAELDFFQEGSTFPFGAHIAVVEVDTETGEVTPLRHVAVDDCGTVINPLLVAGQQHGGVASGISQALYEQVVFDDHGNPVTTTFAEYALPSAAEFATFTVASTVTPTPLNPLGAKGIGEAGTIGSTPATQNAVIDAVAHLGVRHIDMPCTPQRVWQAIADAARGNVTSWREPPARFATLERKRPVAGAPDTEEPQANI